jgi:hypothetical protein
MAKQMAPADTELVSAAGLADERKVLGMPYGLDCQISVRGNTEQVPDAADDLFPTTALAALRFHA